MNKNVFIIFLEGQGDTDVRVVDEETWSWVTSSDTGKPEGREDDPELDSWTDQLVPASQKAKMKEPVVLTSGSWVNDRAIQSKSADGYEAFGYEDMKEALEAIRRHGDTLINVYQGCIY